MDSKHPNEILRYEILRYAQNDERKRVILRSAATKNLGSQTKADGKHPNEILRYEILRYEILRYEILRYAQNDGRKLRSE